MRTETKFRVIEGGLSKHPVQEAKVTKLRRNPGRNRKSNIRGVLDNRPDIREENIIGVADETLVRMFKGAATRKERFDLLQIYLIMVPRRLKVGHIGLCMMELGELEQKTKEKAVTQFSGAIRKIVTLGFQHEINEILKRVLEKISKEFIDHCPD